MPKLEVILILPLCLVLSLGGGPGTRGEILFSQLLTPYDCSEGDPCWSSMLRNPVQGQDPDCPTVLQSLEARPMGMSAATLYGKMAGLKKASASAPITAQFTGAGGPSDSGRDGDTGFVTSQICTPIQLCLSVTLSKLLAISEPQFPQPFKKG